MHLSLGGGALEGSLRPRESRALEVRFAPSARIRPFSEPLIVSVCGLPRPLLVVSGACVAMDLQLEMDQLAFGQALAPYISLVSPLYLPYISLISP